jgi:hypothetical protein
MILRSTIAVVGLATITSVNAGIDLTPSVTEYSANGFKFQQLNFRDDKRRIEYEFPRGWSFDSNANQLHLKPPQKNFAEATISILPLNKPTPLDESAIKELGQQSIVALPPGSQFVKIEEEAANTVLLDGNASVEVTVSYQTTGEKFVRSTLLVNLPDKRLIFRLTARKDDFQALHREFKASILSWRWIDPEKQGAEVSNKAQTTGTQ